MIDSAQLLLVGVVTALTTLLVIVGVQVVYILRELRDSVRKVNKILDDAGLISESVAKPIAGISGFLTLGGMVGAALALILGKEEGEKIKLSLLKKGESVFANLEKAVDEEDKVKQTLPTKTNSEVGQPSSLTTIARHFFHRHGQKLA